MSDGTPSRMPGRSRIVMARSDATEIDGVQGHVLVPTPDQGAWPPFVRFAESEGAAGLRPADPHPHRAEEVLAYVVDGRLVNVDASGRSIEMPGGSGLLLTASPESSHDVGPASGARARWISVVAHLSERDRPGAPSYHPIDAPAARPVGTGVERRELVGPHGPARSAGGLEVAEYLLAPQSAVEIPLDVDRRSIAYVFEGQGRIQDREVPTHSAALSEHIERLMVEGPNGLRLFLASIPIPSYAAD